MKKFCTECGQKMIEKQDHFNNFYLICSNDLPETMRDGVVIHGVIHDMFKASYNPETGKREYLNENDDTTMWIKHEPKEKGFFMEWFGPTGGNF